MYRHLSIIMLCGVFLWSCEQPMTTTSQNVPDSYPHDTNIISDEFWRADAPHLIETDIYIQGAVVKIEAGTIIYFQKDAALNVMSGSGIIADGTTNPIYFQLAAGEQGFWKYIYFADNALDDSCRLINCKFEGGGSDQNWPAIIYCRQVSPTIIGCEIKNSASNGLYLSGQCLSGTYQNNTITSNAGAPIVTSACNIPGIGEGFYSGNKEDCIKVTDGKIESDAIWPVFDLPYHIADDLIIKNADLTLLPGTVIKFYSKKGINLIDNGSITADGSQKQILFSTTQATKGFWKGIHFEHSSYGMLQNCTIEYGGNDPEYPANMYIDQALPRIKNCLIQHSSQYGIYLKGDFFAAEFSNNIITANGNAPVSTNANNVSILPGNSYTGNGYDIIEIRGGVYEGEITRTAYWENLGLPYRINDNLIIRRSTLNVAAGTVIELNTNAHIDVMEGGGLIADGSFNSIRITGVAKYPGFWHNIYFSDFSNDVNCILKNCHIEYGGADHSRPANIYCNNASPTISYCSIENSLYYGIYLFGNANPNLENNIFNNNIMGEIYP